MMQKYVAKKYKNNEKNKGEHIERETLRNTIMKQIKEKKLITLRLKKTMKPSQ